MASMFLYVQKSCAEMRIGMELDLAGVWKVRLNAEVGEQSGDILLPGILQGQGYGNPVSKTTPWVSGLHDSLWWQREEYVLENEIPFLSQPPRHFLGKAYYKREVEIKKDTLEEWYLYIECVHWKTKIRIDDKLTGEDCSICTPHLLYCGRLSKGRHSIEVEIDNSMQYPYRPDGHGVSDALGATWNGMVGEITLLTKYELEQRKEKKKKYAKNHARKIEIKDGQFWIDENQVYFRGTHFGGDYPLTGYPNTDLAWWREKMKIIKKWGLNFIRCHSYCPPEAAFKAADEAGVYIQAECGMWNYFAQDISMLKILQEETRRILMQYGHHPSFVLFSPTNEPSGDWYKVLCQWVTQTRAFDKELGYEGRRVYTAQSGWFYDVPPFEVNGVDYLYFHRSNYGPLFGGTIRNSEGWHGKDYRDSLGEVAKPVICHELGQWCAYPDFSIINDFKGYMHPGNYIQFRENCRRNGLLEISKEMAYSSGKNQVRLYKEDIEANFRTPHIYGFELLDLHDYLGQGTALVGVLDTFWNEKGYVKTKEFRQFCNDIVLLARFPSYIYSSYESVSVPISLAFFPDNDINEKPDSTWYVAWNLLQKHEKEKVLLKGIVPVIADNKINKSENKNYELGNVTLDFAEAFAKLSKSERKSQVFVFQMNLHKGKHKAIENSNSWELTVFEEADSIYEEAREVIYTRKWSEAKSGLEQGKNVIFSPYLSDLDYECPPLSMKNIYWNGQMGPTWGRNLGLMVQKRHPIFKYFPTAKSGGWQWEDILNHARGFCIKGKYASNQVLVRAIDDWNRNLAMALMFEVKTQKGKLILVSADLTGTFEERPAASVCKAALMNYAASEEFLPELYMDLQELEQRIEAHLFPCRRMERLTKNVSYEAESYVENPYGIIEANPNISTTIKKSKLPIMITISFIKEIELKGILHLPPQKARYRKGFIKEYELQVWNKEKEMYETLTKGVLRNTSLSQKIYLAESRKTDLIRLIVHDVYGKESQPDWEIVDDGYYKVMTDCEHEIICTIAKLHIICDECDKADSNDELFWINKEKTVRKKTEIED